MATTWRGQDGSVAIGGTPDVVIGGVYGWTVVTEFAPLNAPSWMRCGAPIVRACRAGMGP